MSNGAAIFGLLVMSPLIAIAWVGAFMIIRAAIRECRK